MMFWPRPRSRRPEAFTWLIVILLMICINDDGGCFALDSRTIRAIETTSTTAAVATTNSKSQSSGYLREEFDLNGFRICSEMSIRNDLDRLEKLMRNCSVIEGNLILAVVQPRPGQLEKDYPTFPELREITGSLVVYRCEISSLERLFPNLSVIRGITPFHDYSLVIYENMQMRNIGLKSLTIIQKGNVRIERNPDLCYVDSIDWHSIVSKSPEKNVIKLNQGKDMCPSCPAICSGSSSGGVPILSNKCWSGTSCQIDNRGLLDANRCEGACIGGCRSGNNTTSCFACKDFYFKGRCLSSCPTNTFLLNERRCVEEQECRDYNPTNSKVFYKPVSSNVTAVCVENCPAKYIESPTDPHKCIKCLNSCPKVCEAPYIVNSISSAKKLEGCTIIKTSLHIEFRGKKTNEGLKYLADIEEIEGTLKVVRTPSVVSLDFLKNLKKIHGHRNGTESVALHLNDNKNLVDLFPLGNSSRKEMPQITNGKLKIYSNERLCYSKIIDYVKDAIDYNYTMSNDDVSTVTNGDRVACNVIPLNISSHNVTSTHFDVKWSLGAEQVTTFMSDHRFIINFLIFYIEAKENVSELESRNGCGDDKWMSLEVEMHLSDNTDYSARVSGLKPNTRYGYYVTSTVVEKSKYTFKSAIDYSYTRPGVPSRILNLRVKPNIHDLTIEWDPPKHPNSDNITYILHIEQMADQILSLTSDECDAKPNSLGNSLAVTEASTERTTTTTTIATPPANSTDCSQCQCSKVTEEDRLDDRDTDIVFEDFIHDRIFSKRVSSVGKTKRHIENDGNINSTNVQKSQKPSKYKDPSLGDVQVVCQPGNETTGYRQCFKSEKNDSLMKTVTGLRHYTRYSFRVFSCIKEKDKPIDSADDNSETVIFEGESFVCSNALGIFERTSPDPNADQIPGSIVVTEVQNNNTKSLRVSWAAPANPNGVIHYYELSQQESKTVQKINYCISPIKYRSNRGIILQDLKTGNYTFQVRARSSNSVSAWTNGVSHYIVVDDMRNTTSLVVSVIVIMMLLLVASVLGVYIYAKRRMSANIPDKVLYASINPEYMSAAYQPDEYEVPRDKVQLLHELGQGTYGMVYQCIVYDLERPVKAAETHCAVKTVKEGASPSERHEFLQEATIMKSFDSYHVVKLLGVVSKGQPLYVIMELMANGDLKTYLRSHRPDQDESPRGDPPTYKQVLQMAAEIADGMAYLGSIKFVHRDLAARNCMVAADMTVKIGDFGMTRDIYETDYYRKGGKGLLPVRWMSPEALKDGVFTVQGDVWSYGVVLWEIVTLATMPYQGLSHEQVLKWVISRHIMERPENCPDKLYEIMKQCWHYNPKLRPKFTDIVKLLLDDTHQRFREISYYTTKVHDNRQDDVNLDDRPGTSGEGTPLVTQPIGHMAPGGLTSLMENPRRLEMGATDIDEESNLYISDDVISDGEGEESGTENWDAATNNRRRQDIGSLPKHNNSDYGSGKSPTVPLLMEEQNVLDASPLRSPISSPSTISSTLAAGDRRSSSETQSKGSKVSSNGSIQSNGRVVYIPMNNRTTAC